MKLADPILASLRGPLVAVALAGCASPVAAPRPPPEIEPIAEPAPSPDVVPYDPEAEGERLARLDRDHAADDRRRAQRIDRRAVAMRPPPRAFLVACGRG